MAKKRKGQRAKERATVSSRPAPVLEAPSATSGVVRSAPAAELAPSAERVRAAAPSSPPPAEVAVAAEVAAPAEVAASTLAASDDAGAPAEDAAAPPASEHRATKRIALEIELHLSSESHFFSGLSGDISEGGVFVSTYRPLAMGSLVDMEFSLPGSDRPLHARGEVRWHRDASPYGPPGVGVAFEELSEEDRRVIHGFCTMRPPLYYDDVG